MSNRPVAKNRNRPAPPSGSGRRTPVAIWIVLGAIVVVALVLAIALGSSQGSRDFTTDSTQGSEEEDLTTAPVEATGRVLPTFDASATVDPAVGTTAPELVGRNFADEPIEVRNDGTPKVLVFLAHWCPVCQDEVPVLVGWSERGGDTGGVEIVAVATSIDRTRANYPPGSWLREERWPWPTLVDDAENQAASVFGLTSFPYFVAVDADGKVVERVSGRLDGPAFEALLRAARTGAPVAETGGASTPASG
jgi:cytochrome c biogenesis protein CcmG, thiol:disulfide interchange protein DsbE